MGREVEGLGGYKDSCESKGGGVTVWRRRRRRDAEGLRFDTGGGCDILACKWKGA